MAGIFPAALCLMVLGVLLHGARDAEQNNDHRALHSNSGLWPNPSPSALADSPVRRHIIIVLEEEPGLMQSALYLFTRHSSTAALISFHNNTLELLRGMLSPPAPQHDLTLLGHGDCPTAGTRGPALLSGHTPDKLVQVVRALNSQMHPSVLRSIDVLSCYLGTNPTFTSQMIQSLRLLNVQTQVSFYNSSVSVSPAGDIMTETGGIWRSHDHRRRITAEVDQSQAILMRGVLGCPGPEHRGYAGHVLFVQRLDWPSHPQMFVPRTLRKKYSCIDCLEGLTWSLFFEESDKRRAPNYSQELNQRNLTAVWLTAQTEDNSVFKHISTIQDLLVEIRYNAREDTASNIYYVLNDCVYTVHWTNISVSLVGKFMPAENTEEMELFMQNFRDEAGSIQTLHQGLKASKFHEFCRQTFQYHHCSYNCELWGQYFMAAVFSASVVNFRVFSLFLMSVIGCEVGRYHGVDSSLCTSFVGDVHPMVTEQPWPKRLRRGFYGGTIANFEMAPAEQQLWLDQVVAKENALYVQSKQIMNVVNHDEQTEVEIFGRIKVMNKYVFSSYLEFFRGTPEGKKLKTGCSITTPESVHI